MATTSFPSTEYGISLPGHYALSTPLRVRHNYPYQGTTDSLTRALRGKFARRPYLGLALEINQKFPRGERRRWLALLKVLRTTLADVLQSFKDVI